MGSTLARRIRPYLGGRGGVVGGFEKGIKGPNMNHLDTNPSDTESKKMEKDYNSK